MNHLPLRPSVILAMHPDPILCAGIAAALRQQPDFEVLVHGMDNLPPAGLRAGVVIADYSNAMQLTDREARERIGLVADVRILVLTSNVRSTSGEPSRQACMDTCCSVALCMN
jgi:hypothetical protein